MPPRASSFYTTSLKQFGQATQRGPEVTRLGQVGASSAEERIHKLIQLFLVTEQVSSPRADRLQN